MIAGVMIDDWKLPVFKRHLEAAGYQYTVHPFTADTLTLKVTCDVLDSLQPIIKAAYDECRLQKSRDAGEGET